MKGLWWESANNSNNHNLWQISTYLVEIMTLTETFQKYLDIFIVNSEIYCWNESNVGRYLGEMFIVVW